MKDETPFWHNPAGIWTQVLYICSQPRYQLGNGSAYQYLKSALYNSAMWWWTAHYLLCPVSHISAMSEWVVCLSWPLTYTVWPSDDRLGKHPTNTVMSRIGMRNMYKLGLANWNILQAQPYWSFDPDARCLWPSIAPEYVAGEQGNKYSRVSIGRHIAHQGSIQTSAIPQCVGNATPTILYWFICGWLTL